MPGQLGCLTLPPLTRGKGPSLFRASSSSPGQRHRFLHARTSACTGACSPVSDLVVRHFSASTVPTSRLTTPASGAVCNNALVRQAGPGRGQESKGIITSDGRIGQTVLSDDVSSYRMTFLKKLRGLTSDFLFLVLDCSSVFCCCFRQRSCIYTSHRQTQNCQTS